ncbi:keratin-associated protein 27-1 [Perognathus longimembris pacificus]|uniref:keratin-associated protein 27-1 n=1 Tax=Perognathus longimembris pacificus TaxID=214514 RepID=UPI002019E0A3|nr:keratin-associated protein 27-1 [Perognathus longimembris pacificus]
MPHRYCHSLRGFGEAPALTVIAHGCNLVHFEDGLFLPSSCHSRTWLLDNLQETCSQTGSYQLTSHKQDQNTEDSCMPDSCFSRVVQTTCSNPKAGERTCCPSGSPPAGMHCAVQPCKSGNHQQMGFVAQTCQPATHAAKCCPVKTPVGKVCQTLQCESSQIQLQIPEASSCSPLVHAVPEAQLLESSSTYEPACCVTGGLQLHSK